MFGFGPGILPDLGSQLQRLGSLNQQQVQGGPPQSTQASSADAPTLADAGRSLQRLGINIPGLGATPGAQPYASDLGQTNFGGALTAPTSTVGSDALASGASDAGSSIFSSIASLFGG